MYGLLVFNGNGDGFSWADIGNLSGEYVWTLLLN